MRAQLNKSFRFEAAHSLPHLPEGHKCRKVHGHSYEVQVSIAGEIDPKMGWIYDLQDISDAVNPIIKQVDHYFLNEIEGLEISTVENLTVWFWRKLEGKLPGLKEITIYETPTSSCTFRGEF